MRRLSSQLERAAKTAIVRGLQAANRLRPRERERWRALRRDRERAERTLAALAQASAERFDGAAVIDGVFDNANYWLRLSLVRAALGLAHGEEIGVTGPFMAREARRTFARLGVASAIDQNACAERQDRSRADILAESLIRSANCADDVLEWRLPFDYPAAMLYDEVLKQQRKASLDVSDPLLHDRVRRILLRLFGSDRLMARRDPRLVLASHVGVLSWIAARRGIPAIVLSGHFGLLRFFKMSRTEQVFDPYDNPTGADIAALAPDRAAALERVGADYIDQRLSGGTNDVGARFANRADAKRIDRGALAAQFGWDPDRPIVAVYASNWFDYPHYVGMSHFRDFLDWLEATLAVAAEVREVNWLFKGHPADAFYGGVTLADLMPSAAASHVRLSPAEWSGADVRAHVDAMVTYHGTAGVEFGAIGKPVLLADRGWYHDCGFALWPRSRRGYLDALRREWWRELDLERCRRNARIFAGWSFAIPADQRGLVLHDDSGQWRLYEAMPALLDSAGAALESELAMIRRWVASDAPHYHTFKMGRAQRYALALEAD